MRHKKKKEITLSYWLFQGDRKGLSIINLPYCKPCVDVRASLFIELFFFGGGGRGRRVNFNHKGSWAPIKFDLCPGKLQRKLLIISKAGMVRINGSLCFLPTKPLNLTRYIPSLHHVEPKEDFQQTASCILPSPSHQNGGTSKSW